jgi:uncharacterized delta-60 repeat protein
VSTLSNRARGVVILGLLFSAACSSPTDGRRREPPPDGQDQFSIGGVVNGLRGSGLVLREQNSGLEVHAAADGPFTIVTERSDGFAYHVQVSTQPDNPAQVCSVVDGVGAIAGANVTNVTVNCDSPESINALDPTFGSGGRATASLTGGATAMALRSDGKIIIGGEAKLLRFNSDGTPDLSFGTSGIADFTFPDVQAAITQLPQGIAVQSDGSIIVVGFAESGLNVHNRFVVARYTSAGVLDPSFDADGRRFIDFGDIGARGRGVAIDASGKIVVAGEATFESGVFDSTDFAVARLTDTGVLDSAFGTNGVAHTRFDGAAFAVVHGVALQRDLTGRIILAGAVARDGGSDPDVALASFKSNGTPDSTFIDQGNPTGRVRTNLGFLNTETRGNALTIAPSGQIIVAGDVRSGANFQYLLARFTAGGSAGAPVTTPFTQQGDVAQAVALLGNGDVIVAGRTAIFGSSDFGVALYTPTGGLETNFGTDGTLAVDFARGIDGATAIAVQPDGKVVVAGFANTGSGVSLGMIRIVP